MPGTSHAWCLSCPLAVVPAASTFVMLLMTYVCIFILSIIDEFVQTFSRYLFYNKN
jgi:hypothetical protein